MNDVIYRQAAIEVLSLGKEILNRVLDDIDVVGIDREKYSWGLGLIESYINDIKELPPAQPERKRGKWIEDGYSHYKAVCSECGEPCATYVMDAPRDRFCKWCGADMRQGGEQDD